MKIKARKRRQGRENKIINQALRSALPTDQRLDRVVFREPELPTGVPDVVISYPSRTEFAFNTARSNLTADHLRVLTQLIAARRMRIDSLAETLSWSNGAMVKILNDLQEARLVHVRGEFVAPKRLSEIFILRRIVAIEGKVKDWKKGLEQAKANTWFASQSYILVPSRLKAPDLVTRARKLGVGVLASDAGGVKLLVESQKIAIPSSFGSWLVNEWTIRRLSKKPS